MPKGLEQAGLESHRVWKGPSGGRRKEEEKCEEHSRGFQHEPESGKEKLF